MRIRRATAAVAALAGAAASLVLVPVAPAGADCPVPGAPASVGVVAGTGEVAVTWDAAADNGTALTGYVVGATQGSKRGPAEATAPADRDATLSGLRGGLSHRVEVRAVSSCGAGPAATSAVFVPTGPAETAASRIIADGPVAYLRLGEVPGTPLLADTVTSTAFATPAPSTTLGVAGGLANDPDTAVELGGSCCAVLTTTLPEFDDPRSVTAWIRPVDTSFRYVAGWGAAGDRNHFSVSISNGNTIGAVTWNDDQYVTTPRTLLDGAWHHVAVTYDGAEVRFYLDGVALGSRSFGAALDTLDATRLYVGANFRGEGPWRGGLDEVAVFPAALSAAKVAAQFDASGHARPGAPTFVHAFPGADNELVVAWGAATSDDAPLTGYVVQAYAGGVPGQAKAVEGTATATRLTGLPAGVAHTFEVVATNVYGSGPATASGPAAADGAATTYPSRILADGATAYFRLGDDAGQPSLADSSGNRAHLARSTPAQLEQPAALLGDADRAVRHDNQCCAIGQGPARVATFASARSIEAWVRPEDASFRYVAGWGSSGTGRASFLFVNGSAFGFVGYGSDITFPVDRPLNDGAWHHLVVTYANQRVVGYLDGQQVGSGTIAAPIVSVVDTLTLGSLYDGGSRFFGGIDEVAAYARVLSAAQVAAHFAAAGYARPAAPATVTATPGGANEVVVTWTAPVSPASPVLRHLVVAKQGARTVAAEYVGGTDTTATLSGLAGGAAVVVEVTGSNAHGEGGTRASAPTTPTGPNATYASRVLSDNPAAYYRLADSGSNRAADASGGAAHATTYAPAVFSQPSALASDTDPSTAHSNACCSLATARPALPLYAGARSIEAWVKPSDGSFRYVAGWGSTSTARSFFLFVEGSRFGMVGYNLDASFPVPRPLNDGAWHHLVLTYNKQVVIGYLDGRKAGEVTLPQPLVTESPAFTIGAFADGGSRFWGGLDEVAAYKKALTAAQVAAHFNASGHARPAAPANVRAVRSGVNSVTVLWDAPPAGSVPVLRHRVQARRAGAPEVAESVGGTATSAVFSGLVGAAAYTFEVVPANAYGDGTGATTPEILPNGGAATYPAAVLADAPSAYWRLGDAGNDVTADSSGRAQDLTYSFGPAQLGQTGAIPAESDTATVHSNACCSVATGRAAVPLYDAPRTLEAWVKPSDASFRYVAGWGSTSTARSFMLFVEGTRFGMVGYNLDASFYPERALNDGAWHHLAITYEAQRVTGYLDGVRIGGRTLSSPLVTESNAVVIGSFLDGGNRFWGGIDEVAVYDRALTAAQVAAHFDASGYSRPRAPTGLNVTRTAPTQLSVTWNGVAQTNGPVLRYRVQALANGTTPELAETVPASAGSAVLSGLRSGTPYTVEVVAVNAYGDGAPRVSGSVSTTGGSVPYAARVESDGPVAYYRLGDAGNHAADSTAGRSDAAFAAAAGLGQPGALGSDPDTAVTWNGSCCGLGTAFAPLPQYNRARTVEAWVRTTDSNFRYVAGWGSSATSRAFAVAVSSAGITVVGWSNDRAFAAPGITNGAWHHVVVTYESGVLVAYLDGVSLGSSSFTGKLNTVGSTLVLGARHDGSGPWNGGLDELAVYPVALTPATVLAHYQAGTS